MKTLVLLLGIAATVAAQDDLPQRGANDRMEFEPHLKLYDVKPEAATGPTDPWAIPADVNKAKVTAERAQQKAKRWQQLQKSGVLSKVEAEKATLQANRAVYRYQQARLAEARKQVETLRDRVKKGEPVDGLFFTAVETLKTSEALATEADALLQRTDVEFAKNQLERQRKLASLGLAPKSTVRRAQENLEKAKADITIPGVTLSPNPSPSR